MTVEEVLEAVEQILQPKQLGPIERLILSQSWMGQTYGEMAKGAGYGSEYLKEIGYQLWQDLSDALGQRVTKKNLHLVLSHYQEGKNNQQHRVPEVFTTTVLETQVVDGIAGSEFDFPSGPVPLDSPLYINRPPVEECVFAELKQPGCFIRIKAPRKMGKSSLLNRMMAHAKELNYQTVYLDFQEADEVIFTTLDKFLRWFCANISRQLNIPPKLDDYWDAEMGSKVSCKIYFEGYVLPQVNEPLLLALNEVNRVFEHTKIAQDFLPMLRFWHELTKQDKTWQKLHVAVVHATEIYVPLKLNQSPFNIGLAISLPQFTLEQVQDLAQRYGLGWATGSEGAKRLARLQAMVGGHPYLVSLALYHLRQGQMGFEQLLAAAPTPASIYSHHLREHLNLLKNEPQLASALEQVVRANESVRLEAIATYKLESMGLVKLDGNLAKLSCQLYRLYFQSQLGEEHQIEESRQ